MPLMKSAMTYMSIHTIITGSDALYVSHHLQHGQSPIVRNGTVFRRTEHLSTVTRTQLLFGLKTVCIPR